MQFPAYATNGFIKFKYMYYTHAKFILGAHVIINLPQFYSIVVYTLI